VKDMFFDVRLKRFQGEYLGEGVTMASQFIDSIVGDIYSVKPGDKIQFKNEGKVKSGTLVTKSGMWWKVRGDDGREYVYQSIVRTNKKAGLSSITIGGETFRLGESVKVEDRGKGMNYVRGVGKIKRIEGPADDPMVIVNWGMMSLGISNPDLRYMRKAFKGGVKMSNKETILKRQAELEVVKVLNMIRQLSKKAKVDPYMEEYYKKLLLDHMGRS